MANLYRKYRPKTFAEVFSQNHIKITLQNEIIGDSLSHAYLFYGPRAVGKTTLARILAKSVNCLNRHEAEPCNECENCQLIASNKSLEIIEIDAASHTGVDNVRENIINSAQIPPSKLSYKVFIIDEVHMLSISAFNALLKLLEEPSKQTMFILCTTEVYKIPETVISRCERFDFKKVSIADTVKKLEYILKQEGVKSDDQVLESIAKQANGYLRDAESLLDQVLSLKKEGKINLEDAKLVLPQSNLSQAIIFLRHLYLKQSSQAISLLNDLITKAVEPKIFNQDLIILNRRICLDKIDPNLSSKLGLDLGPSLEKDLIELEKDIDLEIALKFLEEFINLENKLKNCDLSQLPLEVVIIKLSGLSTKTSFIDYNLSNKPKKENNLVPTSNPGLNQDKKDLDTLTSKQVSALKETDEEVGNISIKEVQSKWKEFLLTIKKHNHSLTFILQNCFPNKIEGGKINLLCKYKFHEERLKSAATLETLEKTCQQVFKKKLKIKTQLDSNLNISQLTNSTTNKESTVNKIEADKHEDKKQSAKENKNNLNSVLNIFGGEIIS